jgi:hypothetical protein
VVLSVESLPEVPSSVEALSVEPLSDAPQPAAEITIVSPSIKATICFFIFNFLNFPIIILVKSDLCPF